MNDTIYRSLFNAEIKCRDTDFNWSDMDYAQNAENYTTHSVAYMFQEQIIMSLKSVCRMEHSKKIMFLHCMCIIHALQLKAVSSTCRH